MWTNGRARPKEDFPKNICDAPLEMRMKCTKTPAWITNDQFALPHSCPHVLDTWLQRPLGLLVGDTFGLTLRHMPEIWKEAYIKISRESSPPQRPSRATWACLVSTACVPVRVTINPLAEGAMFSLSGILHCHAHQKGSQSSRGLIDIRCLCPCEAGKLAFGQGRKAPTACYPACATHATQDEASALTDLTTAPPHNASPEERRARCYPRLVRL